jgi:hypothetical protein
VRALSPRKHKVLLPSHEHYPNPHKPIIHHSIRIHGRRKEAEGKVISDIFTFNLQRSLHSTSPHSHGINKTEKCSLKGITDEFSCVARRCLSLGLRKIATAGNVALNNWFGDQHPPFSPPFFGPAGSLVPFLGPFPFPPPCPSFGPSPFGPFPSLFGIGITSFFLATGNGIKHFGLWHHHASRK